MNLQTRRLRLRHLGLLAVAGALALPAMAEVTTLPGNQAEVPTPPPNSISAKVETVRRVGGGVAEAASGC